MGKYSHINRTYEIPVDGLKRLLIEDFRKSEEIGADFDVDVRFNISHYSTSYRDEPGTPTVTGVTFTVSKAKPGGGSGSQFD